MPFYEYRCQQCEQLHVALQKMSDAPLEECPNCGASPMTKLISASADVSSSSEGPACAGGDVSSAIPPCMSGGCGGCPTN